MLDFHTNHAQKQLKRGLKLNYIKNGLLSACDACLENRDGIGVIDRESNGFWFGSVFHGGLPLMFY